MEYFTVNAQCVRDHGYAGAILLGYLEALTMRAAPGVGLGKVWVRASSRDLAQFFGGSKNTWKRKLSNLVDAGAIERRDTQSGYEYYYRTERLTVLADRLKTLTHRIHSWSNAVKGKKLTPQEHRVMLQEGYLALSRGEPLDDVVATIKVLTTMRRKGNKPVDYDTARYVAIESKAKKAATKDTPERPRLKEVTA